MTLLEKCKNAARRAWYAQAALEHGWSRAVLAAQIETDLHARKGGAQNNFALTLPPAQSDLAKESLKDPYVFDFLNLSDDVAERHLHQGLIDHIRQFILELGKGFAFVGSQYHLEVGGRDYYLDLLFYHLHLRCFVVIDLKVEAFQPEFAGKMNFYLSAADDLLRHADDRPSIGLILCREHDRVTVEYSLRTSGRPLGVASYELTRSLPKGIKPCLPSVRELESEFQRIGRSRQGFGGRNK